MSAPVTAGFALAVLASPAVGSRVQVFDGKKGFWRVGVLVGLVCKKHRHHVEELAEVRTPARTFKVARENVRPCPR